MKTTLAIIFASSLLFIACSKPKNKDISFVIGNYQGTIPCADCIGIKNNIHLDENFSFKESSIYLGKPDNLFEENGLWELKNDSTIILDRDNRKSYYRIKNNSLAMLGEDGEVIEGPLSANFVLHKVIADENSEGKISDRNNKELLFKSSGNEPFWGLSIDTSYQLIFKDLALNKTLNTKNYSTKEEKGIFFINATLEGIPLQAKVYQIPCQDDMSGLVSDNFIELTYGDKSFKGCATFVVKKSDLIKSSSK